MCTWLLVAASHGGCVVSGQCVSIPATLRLGVACCLVGVCWRRNAWCWIPVAIATYVGWGVRQLDSSLHCTSSIPSGTSRLLASLAGIHGTMALLSWMVHLLLGSLCIIITDLERSTGKQLADWSRNRLGTCWLFGLPRDAVVTSSALPARPCQAQGGDGEQEPGG